MENRCYNPNCSKVECFNPEHYNFICFNPECRDKHCEDSEHYNKQLLKKYQEKTDLSIHDHREEIDYDEDVDISFCDCSDCADDNHNHDHDHDHDHEHEHDEEDSCTNPDCDCHDEDTSQNLEEEEEEDELIAEGKPLLYNRSIQIIVSSGILFALGYILNFLSVNEILVNIVFMASAIIAAYELAIVAFNNLFKRHTVGPAMLMCIACVASFIIGHPEEGAAVAFLYYIAEFLEDYSENRAKHSIKSLVEIAPDTATVKIDGDEEIRNVDDVNIGETVIVKPGDKIPLDGEVSLGSSSVNQASITGESLPVHKEVGDEVFSGTVNEDGYLEVIVSKEAKDSVLSKIVTLVKRSQLNRSETETTVEKISKYYTPLLILITLCVALIPPLVFSQDWYTWIYRGLSLMVISCPCAFLISTPIGMVSSITAATRKGVLIKGSSYIEDMRNIKAVIFDKTGTLTEGKLELIELKVIDDSYSKEDIVRIAASLEHQSSHPIAQAIINYANNEEIKYNESDEFKNITGKGIVGFIDGEEYYAGNESLIPGSEFNISQEDINTYTKQGKTLVFIGNSKNIIGIITVSDKIRENAKEVISNLNSQDVYTFMLTGDNKLAATKVGDEIGISYVYSNLLPEDKLDILDTIRNKFGDVAMVGDGINDAPALARANIGIAMGAAGSDVAIETADIALMQDDISKLPYLFHLSNKTMTIIKENITIALIIKFAFIILAILGLVTLMMAVGIGDLGLTLLVILNSFRIGIVKDPLF